jgi:hypothetical protein
MRRLTLAAASVAIVLAACSDQNRETPTGPTNQPLLSAKAATGSCQVPFPLTALTTKTAAMFSDASVRNAAKAKIQSIQKQCAKGKVGNAQHEALTFVDWMLKKYGQSTLPQGTAVRFADLMSTLFVAVGLQLGDIDPGIFGPRGAVGVFIPGEDFDLRNGDGTAAIHLDGDAFDEPTLITIIPLPDNPQLETNGEEQFAPFWDYNAANASNEHNLNPGSFAIIGFCIDDAVQGGIENPQIGHNPLAGGFEILEAASNGEYQDLGLSCPTQLNDPGEGFIGLDFGGGLKAFARSVWKTGAHYARPLAETIFMPEQLHAIMLGQGGLAGRGSNISPFGEVDAGESDNQLGINFNGDPAGRSFEAGAPITWQFCTKGCSGPLYPSALVTTEDGETPVPGVQVHVTLVPVDESGGEFGEGSTVTATTDSYGVAIFDDLTITEEGTYQLRFSAAGTDGPVDSGEFEVSSD